MPRRPFPLPLIILSLLSLCAVSCGGGGSGGSGTTPVESIQYTGKTAPAAVTSVNSEKILEGAFFGPGFDPDDFTMFRAAGKEGVYQNSGGFNRGIFLKTARTGLENRLETRPRFAKTVEDSWSEGGACGGSADYFVRGNDATGDFSGTVTFANYNDCSALITGQMGLSGNIDIYTTATRWIEFSATALTVVSLEGSFSLGGTINVNHQIFPTPTTMNMRMRNNTTGEVVWYENYVVTEGPYGEYVETVISGKYYHPVHGSVVLSTATPFRTAYAGTWPYEGTLLATGQSGSAAKLSAIDAYLYQIHADADGNGTFEYSSQVNHWPGANRMPLISATAGTTGNVGCPATISSSYYDDDGDTPSYSWRIVSAPNGSTASLSNATSANPSFTPDVKGAYVFEVSISDGYITQTAQTQTMTAEGGLFCSGTVSGKVDVGSQATAVAIGDVNGDGRNDVVFVTGFYDSTATDGKLFVMLQDSSGYLSSPVSYALDSSFSHWPRSVTVGDVDGDGKMDVAVGLDRYAIEILTQNQAGGLTSSQVISSGDSTYVRIGDFNNDGENDIAGAGWGTGTATIWYAGDIANPVVYAVDHGGRDDLETGDLNNDGKIDLAVMSGQGLSPDLGVLLQNTGGAFTAPAYYDFGGSILPVGMAAADLTGDGKADLAVASSGWVSVLPQTASGTLGTSDSYPFMDGGSGDIIAGDFNSDGKTDLAAMYGEAGFGIFLQKNDGTLETFDFYTIPTTGAVGYGVPLAAGDINGDGVDDLVGGLWRGVIVLKSRGGE